MRVSAWPSCPPRSPAIARRDGWRGARLRRCTAWREAAQLPPRRRTPSSPSDAQVIGAVQRAAPADAIVVCAAGGLPGELHKLWQAREAGTYHLEYGYSCMGYEIAGGLGVKLACPEREVIVLVGDGSYLMLNSEIATSVLSARSSRSSCWTTAASAASTGCSGQPAATPSTTCSPTAVPRRRWTSARMPRALAPWRNRWTASPNSRPRFAARFAAERTSVVVIRTDPRIATAAGGHWWDVAVPEVSSQPQVNAARGDYEARRAAQRLAD